MKKSHILLILLCLSSISSVHSQCSITDVLLIPSECESDKTFDVSISFTFSGVSDSFLIRGNGNDYGTFAYIDLPVLIQDIPGECPFVYEFQVMDLSDQDCKTEVNISQICCFNNCNIQIDSLHFGLCTEEGIDLSLKVSRTGTDQTGFDLFSGTTFIGYYEYSDNFIEIENFLSSNTSTETIIVCNNDNLGCCDTMIVETPCGCAFLDKSAKVVECSLEKENFFVEIDFIPQMLSDSFLLGGNSINYGNFAYSDLPITVGPLPFSNSTRYEFVFLDRISSFCFDFVEIGIINNCNFPCEIKQVEATITPCELETFYATLFVDAEGTTADSFSVRGNGRLYGRFAYGQNSYEIGPLEGDCATIYEFIVIDDNDDTCRNFTDLGQAVCCILPCPLDAIQSELICDENELIININTNDSGDADTVYVYINQEYFVPIGYNEFPFRYSLPSDIEFPVLLRAVDPINSNCVLESLVENKCDLCQIGELEIDILQCDDSNANIIFTANFDHNQHPDSLFSLFLYAEKLGTYRYGDLPLNDLTVANPNFEMQFTVVDETDENCRNTQIIEKYSCSTSTKELMELQITYKVYENLLEILDPNNRLESTILYNLNGQIIESNFRTLELSNLPNGVYFLYLQSGPVRTLEKLVLIL